MLTTASLLSTDVFINIDYIYDVDDGNEEKCISATVQF